MSAAEKLTVHTPGIYLRGDIDYGDVDAVNYSTLKEFGKSARHYMHAVKRGFTTHTKATLKGSISHTAILEPDRLPLDFVVYDGARTGNAWKDFKAVHSGRDIVTADEYRAALQLRDAVRNDSVAGPLVVGGHREATLIWDDPTYGVRCKGRLDLLRADNQIIDLKTTRCARHFEFARDVAKYQYHVQAALYSDGHEVITHVAPAYKMIVVESVEPYDVVVYELGEDVIGPGRDAYRGYLSKLIDCRRDNAWPGYAGGLPQPLKLPAWCASDDDDMSALGLE